MTRVASLSEALNALACFSQFADGHFGADVGLAATSRNDGGHIGSLATAHPEVSPPQTRDTI